MALVARVAATSVGCEWLDEVGTVPDGWQACLDSWQLAAADGSGGSIAATVPSTVLGALVEAGAYGGDPYYDLGLQNISAAPFVVPWRYASNVTLPANASQVWLIFEGLSYQADGGYVSGLCPGGANVQCCREATPLCNSPGQCQATSLPCDGYYAAGQCPGGADVQCCRPAPPAPQRQLVGTVRTFQVDVSGYVDPQRRQQLVEVELDRPRDSWQESSNDTDLAVSFIDWAPSPADGSMGLWKAVSLLALPAAVERVVLQWPGVVVVSLSPQLAVVDFVFDAWRVAGEQRRQQQQLLLSIDELPGWSHTCNVSLSAAVHSQIAAERVHIASPTLWWPWNMLPAGATTPQLYTLRARLAGGVSNTLVHAFGLRTVTSALNGHGHRQFYVNGVPFVPLGAGGCPDLLLRASYERIAAELALVRHAGLNAVRWEGKFPPLAFYRLADRLGVAVLPGFECCDAWQRWPLWNADTLQVAAASLRSQLQLLRGHASVFAFLLGSDQTPPAHVEAAFQLVVAELRWPNVVLTTAAALPSALSGQPSGVKMTGPYAWVPPVYWSDPLNRALQLGGPFGFLTEGGPGAAPLTYASWARTVAPAHRWPADGRVVGDPYWDGHCGNPQGLFGTLKYFDPPLTARYGRSCSAQQYLLQSQTAAYESHRVMFEEYACNQVTAATGLIHWMLTSAYPSHMWRLYDWYLAAGGSYYAVRKALADPVHAMYRYADHSVWLYSNLAAALPPGPLSVPLTVQLVAIGPAATVQVVHAAAATVDFSPPATRAPIDVPASPANVSATYLVRLAWSLLGVDYVNDYWLSSVARDVLDWKATTFYQTPCSAYADMTQLQSLYGVRSDLAVVAKPLDNYTLAVTVLNQSPTVFVFAVEALLANATDTVLPQLWSDNYFNLMPGESRAITVTTVQPLPAPYTVTIHTWNDLPQSGADVCINQK